MPTSDLPQPFSDEELLDLLRDESVSPQAIASEMEDAGAAPHPPELLAIARQLLKQPSQAQPAQVEALPAALRTLVVEAAIQAKAGDLLAQLCACRDKGLAKEAKRGLHVLKTQGMKIEAPRPASTSPVPGAALPPASEELRAYMSSVDGFGERVIFYTCPTRSGVDVAQVVVSDETGIVNATLAPLGRKEYRRFVQGLGQTAGVLVGEVPRTYARALIAQALDRNARARQPIPASFNEVSFALGATVPAQPSPGRSLPAPEDVDALAARGGELTALSELRTWLPQEATLKQLALRLDEIAVSPLYLDEAQRTASAREALNHAVSEYWTPSRRQQVAERLFDVAYLLHGAGRQNDAQLALASAHALASDRPIEQVGLAYALFERVLAIRQTRSAPAPSERTTSSGLIVPG